MNLPIQHRKALLLAALLLAALLLASLLLAAAADAAPDAAAGPAPPASAAAAGANVDEAAAHVQFVEDFTASCVARNGVMILVKSDHPSRTLRVWLDRIHMGVGTGDRSRTDLAPGAEPEALGCSRSLSGTQRWKLVRAVFVD